MINHDKQPAVCRAVETEYRRLLKRVAARAPGPARKKLITRAAKQLLRLLHYAYNPGVPYCGRRYALSSTCVSALRRRVSYPGFLWGPTSEIDDQAARIAWDLLRATT